MREIVQRTLTGISLIAVLPGSILWGVFPFLFIILLIYSIGALELQALGGKKRNAGDWLVFLSGFLFVLGTGLGLVLELHPMSLLLPLFLWIAGYLLSEDKGLSRLNPLWLALPLSAFFATAWLGHPDQYRPLLPLLIIALVWINDIFAYLGGTLYGKHALTPRLSPGKTVEGSLTGLVVNLLTGFLISKIGGLYTPGILMLVAALVSILCLGGDLYESALKRKFGVKDSGKILPGHGGILDRFDSLLFVAPITFVTLLLYHFLK